MKVSISLLALAGLVLLMEPASRAAGEELTTLAHLRKMVGLRHLTGDSHGNVSGTLVNHTGLTLRDVKLQIDYAWLWQNDFKPGPNNPGRTVYITAPGDIQPHGQSAFSYQPSPPLASPGG